MRPSITFAELSAWLTELPIRIGRYLLTVQVTDILDIAILVFVLYKILALMRTTRAASLLKGLFVFFAALLLSYVLQLNSIYYLMSRMVQVGVLALIILFQPEIRRILEEMGSRRFIGFFSHMEGGSTMEQTIGQTVLACTEMSQSRTGALIVFEREILLDDMVRSGTMLDAAVSSELLKNIFFVKAPMHDGAVIIRHGRMLGAGCMLPLSKNVNLSRDPGRHRHERELRRGGGHRVGGDRLHLRGHRRDAQAAPEAGDPGEPPAERAASAGGVRRGQAAVQSGAAAADRKGRRRRRWNVKRWTSRRSFFWSCRASWP